MAGVIRPRVAVVEQDPIGPLGRMGNWLEDAGLDLQEFRPYNGDPLPPLGAFDALIVLGGQPGAWEDARAPWLPTLRSLMAATCSADTPLLGLCLGAQLLAAATGGEVHRTESGPEIGVVTLELTAAAREDELLGGLSNPFTSFSYHYDSVTALPPEGVILGSNDSYARQIFRVGGSAWGFQSHPETDPERFLAWVAGDSAGLSPADRERTRTEVLARAEELLRDSVTLAERFAALVVRRTEQTG